MSLFKQFATDKEKETNGVEVQFGENEDGSTPIFIISRMASSNKKYNKALENSTRPYRRQIELDIMPNEQAEKLMMKVFVDTILIGWKNVQGENGETLQFNRENALRLFEALPELYADLKDRAQKAAMFRVESLENEAKN
jgi:hypothetical protein